MSLLPSPLSCPIHNGDIFVPSKANKPKPQAIDIHVMARTNLEDHEVEAMLGDRMNPAIRTRGFTSMNATAQIRKILS